MSDHGQTDLSGYILHLGIGSNIRPDINIPAAIESLRNFGTIITQSSIWKSPAVGTVGPDFLNAAISIHTKLSPEDFKAKVIRKVESDLGRIRGNDKNAPRTIDIDILIANGQIFDQDIWHFPHIAIPLSEIYPNLTDPTSGVKLSDIIPELTDTSLITKYP